MKKRFALTLALLMVLIFPMNAFAANSNVEENEQRIYFMDDDSFSTEPVINMRAVSAPTSYAPASWYNVNHSWTAKYYTYTSYYFDTSEYPNLDVAANSPFTVEFYRTNGSYIGSVTPSYDSSKGKYYGAYFFLRSDDDYYMIIRNNSSVSITSGAWYRVGESYEH